LSRVDREIEIAPPHNTNAIYRIQNVNLEFEQIRRINVRVEEAENYGKHNKGKT
jgi:hypothetical protein